MSTICDLVAQVTRAAPESVALEAGSSRMSYQQLDWKAARLAAHLKNLGAAEEIIVGVCLPRSFAQILACLAVLKSGAAYLPLDPTWPQERLRSVLDDAGALLVITTSDLAKTLLTDGCSPVVFESDAPMDDANVSNQSASIGSEHLAYVIYTSGSTGEPKGVEVTHSNLANLISWHRQSFSLRPEDRVSHLAGLSFDASVWEVWATLGAGATLILPNENEDVRMSSTLLRDWLVEREITVAFVPTVLAEPLMKANWSEDTSLRLLLTGAETLHTFPRPGLPFVVVNNYGPTECAVVATSGVVPSESNQTTTLPTIGRPIAKVQVYILDEDGKPARDGESGEIYIGGAGVARGYRNRPDLAAKRFLADPFSAEENARMYRTGDLGRTLPDGQVVFEGRVDNQEKIRGYRIEPDEIASALNRHPAVSSSVVTGDGAAVERRLVAYFVPAGGEIVTAHDLREFLSGSLPDHMVPSMFIKLDALPQTSQGKLDRAALPKPTAEQALSGLDYRAPATPTERGIAAIVAKVLRTDQIGADDNFFLLGGHSLLGTQVVIQVRQAFGIELTLRHLFNAPTVARLAAKVESLVLQKVQAMTDEEARFQAERISVIG